MPKERRITQVRRAGEHHQVLTVAGGKRDPDKYQRRPCKTCPWRKDAVGEFPAEAFRHSASTIYDMARSSFACHSAGAEEPKTCAGFLLSTGAEHNLHVRLDRMERQGYAEVSADGLPLFGSYREMAVANGVDPNDPVLIGCV